MQFILGLTWVACTALAVSLVAQGDPELAKLYQQVQQQHSSSGSNPGPHEVHRYLEGLMPILLQVGWGWVALASSLLGFFFLGFVYGRMCGSSDYIGVLVLFSMFSGQNPLTLALEMSNQGVSSAHLSWPLQILLVLLQLLAATALAEVGARIFRIRLGQRNPNA